MSAAMRPADPAAQQVNPVATAMLAASSVRAETVDVYLKVRAQIARVAGQPVVALALLL
jgi:hypothetical protein